MSRHWLLRILTFDFKDVYIMNLFIINWDKKKGKKRLVREKKTHAHYCPQVEPHNCICILLIGFQNQNFSMTTVNLEIRLWKLKGFSLMSWTISVQSISILPTKIFHVCMIYRGLFLLPKHPVNVDNLAHNNVAVRRIPDVQTDALCHTVIRPH